MKRFLKWLYALADVVFKSIVSILSVLIFSKFGAKKRLKHTFIKQHNQSIVLGNGPSLHKEIENLSKKKAQYDFFAVNAFCLSEWFSVIQPCAYVLQDNAWFEPKDERNRKLSMEVLAKINEVNWPMTIFIPARFKGKQVNKEIKNTHIRFSYYNDTPVNGFKFIRTWLYQKQLGLPRCQNVLNAAIGLNIFLQYKDVYIYGADHSWTLDLFVNDENVVCYGDRHVYNTNLTIIKQENDIASILLCFSRAFESHMLLRDFSDTEGIKIYNNTVGSFIDAYERNGIIV